MNKVERAKEIFQSTEWSGDPRINMLTLMNAGKTLLREIERLEEKIEDMYVTQTNLETQVVSLTCDRSGY